MKAAALISTAISTCLIISATNAANASDLSEAKELQEKISRMQKMRHAMFEIKQNRRMEIKGSISPNLANYHNTLMMRMTAASEINKLMERAHPGEYIKYDPVDTKLIQYLYAAALKPNQFITYIETEKNPRKASEVVIYLKSDTQFLIANTALPTIYDQASKTIRTGKGKYLKLREIAQSISRAISQLDAVVVQLRNEFTPPLLISKSTRLYFELHERIYTRLRKLSETLSLPERDFELQSSEDANIQAETKKTDLQDDLTYANFTKGYNQYWKEFAELISRDTHIRRLDDGKYRVTVYYTLPNPTYIGMALQRLVGGTISTNINATNRFPIPVTPIPKTRDEIKQRLSVLHTAETKQPVLVIRAPGQKARYLTIFGIGQDEGPFCDKPDPKWKASELLRRYWTHPDTETAPKVCFGLKNSVTDALGRIKVVYEIERSPTETKKFPKLEITYSDRDRK